MALRLKSSKERTSDSKNNKQTNVTKRDRKQELAEISGNKLSSEPGIMWTTQPNQIGVTLTLTTDGQQFKMYRNKPEGEES